MSEKLYVELIEGEKFAGNNTEIADTPDSFENAGYVIQKDEVIIDIDDLDKKVIQKMLDVFDIKTETVWTDRGVHLYFKKPSGYPKKMNKTTALGFEVEYKTAKDNEYYQNVVVKRDGKMRKIENEGLRQTLPDIFRENKRFQVLLGMDEGDGRNNALFAHNGMIQHMDRREVILRFINNNVFARPLDEKEFEIVSREVESDPEKMEEYEVAEHFINQHKIVKYRGLIYFQYNGEYVDKVDILDRLIWAYVGSKKTRFIEEVKKQIETRCKIIPDETVFDIKLKNGILRDGRFIPIEDYDEFTPYVINAEYDPDAELDEDVESYMNHLTESDPNYKKLLYEVMAHCLVVDPEMKRLLAKFFIFVGGGGNGKGTLLMVLKGIFGSHNCGSLSIQEMAKEQYLATLQGKLVNLGDDMQTKPIDGEEMKLIKNITSCDYVPIRRLYEQSQDIQLTCSLIFTSNHNVKTFEKGDSVKRRIVWLPMYTVVDEKNRDPKFISKLSKEKAVKWWIKNIVDAYQRLYENCDFTRAEAVKECTKQWHADNDPSLEWVEDLDIEDIYGKTPPEVYREYEQWVIENIDEDAKPSRKILKENILKHFHDYGLQIISVADKRRGRIKKAYGIKRELRDKLVASGELSKDVI